MADIKNKNELKRRIDMFLHEFSSDEYKMNEEYCKETMRMMAEYIGTTNQRIDQKDKQLTNLKHKLKTLNSTCDTVESHSEQLIVEECINLMKTVYDDMLKYLEYMDIDYTSCDEVKPIVTYSYFDIVQQLLLLHTHHSGGTSTRKKCQELGLDSYNNVKFEPNID